MMRINGETTVNELIAYLKSDSKKSQTTMGIHSRDEGDQMPKGFVIVITDNPESKKELEELYKNF